MKYLILLLILVGCSDSPLEKKKPKFKAGDCIVDVNDHEFKELIECYGLMIYLVAYNRLYVTF